MGEVIDHAGLAAIDADKTESPEDGVVRKMAREKSFVAETVLESEEDRAGLEEWREEIGERFVRGRLDRDDDEIDWADFFRRRKSAHRIEMQVASDAADD